MIQAMLPHTVVLLQSLPSQAKFVETDDLKSTELVSIFDRSFLYGDSLYEVVRTYRKKPAFLTEHLDRLAASFRLCHFEPKLSAADQASQGWPMEKYGALMEQALDRYFKTEEGKKPGVEAYCRIIVSRGAGKIGFGRSNIIHGPTIAVIVQKLDPPGRDLFERGFHYKIVERARNSPRALPPAMKSGNYLNNLLAYLEGTEEKPAVGFPPYDDALICDLEGNLTEGTTFNVFYVKSGVLFTSPLDVGILDGITRRKTIELAQQMGIPVREVRFPKTRLYEADEVFMTSTIKEVFPVTLLDSKKIKTGKPGPLTRKLAHAFSSWIDQNV